MIYSVGNRNPILVGHFRFPTVIHIQVKDGNTLSFAHQPGVLINPGPGGTTQGLALTSAVVIQELTWHGELWAISDAATALVDIEAGPTSPP